jgi:hypothetical protein
MSGRVSQKTLGLMDQLAELVAEGSSVVGAGRELGLTQSRADQLWQRIKKPMGMQAA